MGLYEVQVLDVFDNVDVRRRRRRRPLRKWPPLVNAARKPGEWQTYDIVFEAPRFAGDKLEKPAYLTVFWNGVIVHHRKEAMGPMVYRQGGQICAARGRTAAAAAGPRQPGEVQEHLAASAVGIRPARKVS